jgi:hypothetical protein
VFADAGLAVSNYPTKVSVASSAKVYNGCATQYLQGFVLENQL